MVVEKERLLFIFTSVTDSIFGFGLQIRMATTRKAAKGGEGRRGLFLLKIIERTTDRLFQRHCNKMFEVTGRKVSEALKFKFSFI